jgi:two-component system sensor histidine kinase YesM
MCDFAQMIRYNTTASSTMLPLREELNHVRNYVSLQRCRYGNSVVLRVHAAEALLNLPIPRFLLQPIVENSFEHGFAGKAPDAERLIVVSARKVGKRLILRVRDNGQGMEPGQVEAMNRKFAQPYDALALHHEKEHGIGLENINDRLRIFSRSDDRLVLRSRRGRYTSMFILLGQQE